MCVTGWRKRQQFFVLRQRLIAAAVLSCLLFAPSRSYSERRPNKDECVVLELSALGKQGDTTLGNGGLNSTILLNANGPFFNRTSRIMQLDPRGMLLQPGGNRLLVVSSYSGNTPEAQITILLHEWDTSSGVFLRTTIPGTADLSEHLRSVAALQERDSRGCTQTLAKEAVLDKCLEVLR